MRRLALAALTAFPIAASAAEPQPPAPPAAPPALVFARGPMLGVELVPTTPELRAHLGGDDDKGVLVGRVLDDSPASRAGMRVGDLIVAIDGEPVNDANSVKRALARNAGADVRIELMRNGKRVKVGATLPDGDGAAGGVRFGPWPSDGAMKRYEWVHPDGEDHGRVEGRVFEWHGDDVLPDEIRDTVRKALEDAGLTDDGAMLRLDAEVEDRLERMDQRLDALQDRLDAILDALDE